MARNTIPVSGTSTINLHGGNDEIVTSVVFEVSSASSLSMLVQMKLKGNATTPANVQYVNLLTGAVAAAGTALTADGVYGVFCPGCQVSVKPSSGTATVNVMTLAGKVF